MKETIFRGWTLRRVLYVVLGVFVIAYAIAVHRYWGGLLGIYFAGMGIWNFGCAGGACSRPVDSVTQKTEETDLVTVKK